MQKDILLALNTIEDPELGVGIVDLGLVYLADWTAKGIEVEFTTTTPSCPFGEQIFDQIADVLRRRFGEAASIRLRLVRDPPWTLERMTDNARRRLGWGGSRATRSDEILVERRHRSRHLMH